MSTSQEAITESDIRRRGVRMDGVEAVQIVYGVGRTRAYEMLRNGEVDFPVLRCGRKYVAPTAGVLRALGLSQDQAS